MTTALTIGALCANGDLQGLIFHCGDHRCGRVVWRDPEELPSYLTIPVMNRRMICDWCGSLRGQGVIVEPINFVMHHHPPTPYMIAERKRQVADLKAFTLAHPFGSRCLDGLWGRYPPAPALLDAAHVRLGLPMCTLFSNTIPQEAMRRVFEVEDDRLGNQPPLPAIFPDMEAPIVLVGRDGKRRMIRGRWGWSKAKFGWVVNIRNLAGWPWKTVIAEPRQRCLVPASSFAEYHPTEKDAKGHKKAVWFGLKGEGDRPPFAFAGLMRRWSWRKDGLRKKADQPLADADAVVIAFAFLTTEPNEVVRPIHPKAMPVILRPEQFTTWLTGDAEAAARLQAPLPEDDMDILFIGEKEDRG